MNKFKLIFCVIFLALISCKKESKKEKPVQDLNVETVKEVENLEELKYVTNDNFPIGDVRRYGIKIEGGDPKHPYTQKLITLSLFELAEKENIELFFPKGFYKFGLYFKGVKNVKIKFDEAEFAGTDLYY